MPIANAATGGRNTDTVWPRQTIVKFWGSPRTSFFCARGRGSLFPGLFHAIPFSACIQRVRHNISPGRQHGGLQRWHRASGGIHGMRQRGRSGFGCIGSSRIRAATPSNAGACSRAEVIGLEDVHAGGRAAPGQHPSASDTVAPWQFEAPIAASRADKLRVRRDGKDSSPGSQAGLRTDIALDRPAAGGIKRHLPDRQIGPGAKGPRTRPDAVQLGTSAGVSVQVPIAVGQRLKAVRR
ncbi:MAG: hypothetical protein M3Q40_01160 [Pseudomonadota bacterium]|nr:hypothetical protein [Pseudomonadota bacterium]